ncbi:hypothetical protein MMB75_16465 [Paenibacillus sp. P2(2022)]|nr:MULTISPECIES: hypothetical protein [Paenibacillus]MDG0055276.1 hypothetical protein [Paenibacillus sp. P2(2022)]NMP08309.1 hypothetical protein [Paenibacillus polymyxa]
MKPRLNKWRSGERGGPKFTKLLDRLEARESLVRYEATVLQLQLVMQLRQ